MSTIIHQEEGGLILQADSLESVPDAVGEVDAIITDTPYSERTHKGHNAARRNDGSVSRDSIHSNPIVYQHWTDDHVGRAVELWGPRNRGWWNVCTDHVLWPSWEKWLTKAGLYVFHPLAAVVTGSRVRLAGDGPSNWITWLAIARPKCEPYSKWGTLSGGYSGPSERQSVVGGKPLWLMRQIVDEYSRPRELHPDCEASKDRCELRSADTVWDPCCGGGTTLRAATDLGRRFVGQDIMRKHCLISKERLNQEMLIY